MISKPLFAKHTLEHGLPVCGLSIRVVTIRTLPSDIVVFGCGNSANAILGHIAHHAECVGHKQGRYRLHVVAQLQVGVEITRLLAGG